MIIQSFKSSSLFFALLYLVSSGQCMEEDPQTIHASKTQWTSFEAYKADMQARGCPLTLIVGCGHRFNPFPYQRGKHSHHECWCVDIAECKVGNYSDPSSTQPHWKQIEANDELDITALFMPIKYQSQFDTVLLERILETTLNHPRTLYNASWMLKVGGELVVDCNLYSSLTYNYNNVVARYENNENAIFAFTQLMEGTVEDDSPPQMNVFNENQIYIYNDDGDGKYFPYPKRAGNFSFENILAFIEGVNADYNMRINPSNITCKLEKFKVKKEPKDIIRFTPSNRSTITTDIGDFLAKNYFTDIVCIGEAYQPWGEILTTSIVSATKTEDVTKGRNRWHQLSYNAMPFYSYK